MPMTIPEPVPRANVELSCSVAIPIAVAEDRKSSRVRRDIFGSNDEKDVTVTRRTEREKRRERWRSKDERREIGGTLAEDAGKNTDKRAVTRRFFVLVGVLRIGEAFWRWNFDDVTDARSFTRR